MLGFKITKEYPKAYFMDSSYQGKYQMTLINDKFIKLKCMCGGFSKKVKVGDVIIPRKVLSEEGTSLHYYENIKFVEQSEILISKGLSYFNQYFNTYQLNTVTNWGSDVSQLVIDKQYEHVLIWKSI
ncbi:hypothetical protein KTC96_11300 [Clostridium estertheticum]|uniref:hypothetical protein n=1 Tax=Clostridium estertheticum TaxID=238834 RepID=UPI001C7D71E3|nr:hypothetical protein [Clostridium estertheticum]MBX4262719.1 hypothetical protein [Clostridium estertheticum]WLC68615.1 hypothetical protein KTC96_11300 [Clostridium estertheticum]